MSEKYDCIIIGAGIGGLTAASILARNGKKVLVLEKNPKVGGYAVNFRRGQFEFDASLHMINGCNKDQSTYNILKKCGIIDKIKILAHPYISRTIFPDYDFRVPQANMAEYINILVQYFPKEREGIGRFFEEMRKVFVEGKQCIYSKIPLLIEIFYFPFKYPNLFKYSFITFRAALNRFLKDERLKALIAQFWMFTGTHPNKLCAFFYLYPDYDYLNNGANYIKGGSQSLSNALLETIRENGGEVLLNTEVKNILVDNCTAKGISTQKEEYFADTIISGMDARKTFSDLIGERYLKPRFIKKLMSYDAATSFLVVYLGLGVDLKDKGISDYEIFYNLDYDLEKQFNASVNNNMEETSLMLTIHSNIDEDVVPRGKSSMSISTLSGYDYWTNLSKDDYNKTKNRLADILIKRAERVIPNLSSYIEKIEVATPLTMERYTGNYKGAVLGFSQTVFQSGIWRLPQKAPIKNLYLANAWTWLGGGISCTLYSGERIAEAILKRYN